MKKQLTILIFLGLFLNVHAQEDLAVNNFWTYNGDMTNALYLTIRAQAFTQLDKRRMLVDGLKTKNDWERRQAEVKKIMTEMMGEFPAKMPLNPVITGTIKKDGFVVEKLYFESRPGFYVTAALYMPSVRKGKLPAILYCSGHYGIAFRNAGYQRTILNLVKKGFIVLAFDPIGQGERFFYFNPDGTMINDVLYQHSYPGTQMFVSGLSPQHHFVWDGIRAVDYLVSRKEVDPTRIGLTGQSGGGTQTMYLGAMDDRIVAAAPECYITSFDKLMRSRGPQDAEQNMMYALAKGIDFSDWIEVRAPRPTLIVSTIMDIFSIQGARDVFNEAKRAYAAFGVPENMAMSEDDGGHVCTTKNREAIISFFQKHLNHPGDPKEVAVEVFDAKDLQITATGQVLTSLKGETFFGLLEKFTNEALKKGQSEKQNNPNFYSDLTKKAKALIGYNDPVPSKEYIFSGRLWRDDRFIEKYLLKGTGDYYIPLLRLSSEKNNGKTILLLDDQGKASAAAKGGLADQLAQKGYNVIVPDLNGYGELSGGYTSADAVIQGVRLNIWYAGLLAHKSPLAIRVEEIKIIVAFIHESGFTGSLIGLSSGTLAPDLLHAALFNREFAQIALINPLFSYQSIVQEKDYRTKYIMSTPGGVISQYDLPDIIASLAPIKICLINPVNALDQQVDNVIFEQKYTDVKQKYGASPNWTVAFQEQNIFSKLSHWLE